MMELEYIQNSEEWLETIESRSTERIQKIQKRDLEIQEIQKKSEAARAAKNKIPEIQHSVESALQDNTYKVFQNIGKYTTLGFRDFKTCKRVVIRNEEKKVVVFATRLDAILEIQRIVSKSKMIGGGEQCIGYKPHTSK